MVSGLASLISRIRADKEVSLVHKLDEIIFLRAWFETCIVVLAHSPQEVGQLLTLVLECQRTAHSNWGTGVSLGFVLPLLLGLVEVHGRLVCLVDYGLAL